MECVKFQLIGFAPFFLQAKRLSAQEALDHPWFREHPLPKDLTMMPTFPGTNEALHGAAAHR